MGSSASFNPFPVPGRVRCGALLALALQPAARAAPGGCPTPHPAGLGPGHDEGGRIVEFPSPTHAGRASEGPGKENGGYHAGSAQPCSVPRGSYECWERE